jgi:UDP-glucose 4-epimerase
MEKVLITGSNGSIGSSLVRKLVKAGYDVFGVDLNSSNLYLPQSNFFCGDILSNDFLHFAERVSATTIIHLAAQINVIQSNINPIHDAKTNILGSIALANTALKTNVVKFIYANSGGAIYAPSFTANCETSTTSPQSAYGLSKLTGENYLQLLFRNSPIDFVSLRLSNVYGGDSTSNSNVISIWLRQIENEAEILCKDPEARRDFIHVDDVCDAIRAAMSFDKIGVVNIGSGVSTSLQELIQAFEIATKRSVTVQYGQLEKSEIRFSTLCICKMKKLTGWKPAIKLEDGLKRMLIDVRASNV